MSAIPTFTLPPEFATIFQAYLSFAFFAVCDLCDSVSTFDPDSKFFPGVLLRLEAAMGIQIVSAIANVYSKVATKSGVQLEGVELPDPQEEPSKYVMEVISMWSAGHNRTWRELLDVLRDVELQDLSQQIEAYMKGVIFFLLASYKPYLLHEE